MKSGPEKALADHYLDRLAKAGPAVGLEFDGVTEISEGRSRNADERKREEAARLLALGREGVLVLLDERGKNFTSRQLAEKFGQWRDAGERKLVVAIGGPDGHPEELRSQADLCLSFGAQTWPHQLVRIMLAEQLYRIATILAGHPYHRD